MLSATRYSRKGEWEKGRRGYIREAAIIELKMRILRILVFLFLLFLSSCGNRGGGDERHTVSFVTLGEERKLDVKIDGKLFTSFCWPENVYKPILYPLLTESGTLITRGFPLSPREGERNDHIHQVGVWLNYGNVNGIDFWGNGHRGIKEPGGGEIRHLQIERLSSSRGKGSFVSAESWLAPWGRELLSEKSAYHFSVSGGVRIIDRVTTLTAGDSAVAFSDTKEGMFGVRVARQLELPSGEGVVLLDSTLAPSAAKDTLNYGVSGNYLSSEGISGEAVWGTRARWMLLTGMIG
nr:PmoA family protein [Bacteroidales bacterium]